MENFKIDVRREYEMKLFGMRLTGRQRRVLWFLCSEADWDADEISVPVTPDRKITEATGLRQDVVSMVRRDLAAIGIISAVGARNSFSYVILPPEMWVGGDKGGNHNSCETTKCGSYNTTDYVNRENCVNTEESEDSHKTGEILNHHNLCKTTEYVNRENCVNTEKSDDSHGSCETSFCGKSHFESRKSPSNLKNSEISPKNPGFPPHPLSQRGNNYNYAVAACSSDPPSKSVKNRGPEANEEVKILMDFGIPADEAESIASSHSSSQIRKQAFYMPYRENILYPDRALVAAIEKSWKKPPLAPLWPGEKKRLGPQAQKTAPNGSGFIKYDIMEFLDGNLRVID